MTWPGIFNTLSLIGWGLPQKVKAIFGGALVRAKTKRVSCVQLCDMKVNR